MTQHRSCALWHDTRTIGKLRSRPELIIKRCAYPLTQ
jgi:hypothetical protein